MKRAWVEWAIGTVAIVAGMSLAELWKFLIRRLPSRFPRTEHRAPSLGDALETGGPDDAAL